MSISTNFPAIKPSLMLDFANTGSLDPRVTFSRASTATYYDGVTTAKAEENLLLQSQNFTTTWVNVGSTSTANTSVAPDGAMTATTIVEDTATTIHLTSQSVTVSGTVTFSVFAKLGSGTRFLTIGLNRDTTHTSSATFDLSLGTNTQTQVNGGIYSSPSATITSVAQGFYRCTFTVTTDTATSLRIGLNDTGTPTIGNRGFGVNYTGDGTSSLIIWGAQVEQRSAVSSYTVTTTQPIVNYIPVLQTAAANVARFDHNPTTGEALGLLIEEQRTNLLTYSAQFDNAAWLKSNATVTTNTVVAPDGTLTGDKLVEDAASASHFVRQNYTSTVGVTYVSSVYLKAAERTSAVVIHYDGASFCGVSVNLSTGVLSAPPADIVITDASSTSTVSSIGNGWYRVSVSRAQVSTTTTQLRVTLQSGSNGIYTGNGYSGIYIWGAQLEAGAFPTSYIATTSAQVTRSADTASMTGTNFSSWYNAGEGTVYSESQGPQTEINASFNPFTISDSTNTNFIQAYRGYSGSTARSIGSVTTNGVSQMFNNTVNLNVLTPAKQAFAFATNDAALSYNNASIVTDTSVTLPTVNAIFIGANALGTSGFINGTIKKISYYPQALTAANLQALTS